MKMIFGMKNWMFPMPVLMIGTYNDDGTPNMQNTTRGGITLAREPDHHLHRHLPLDLSEHCREEGLHGRIGTADTVGSCDYLGLANGNDVADKWRRAVSEFMMYLGWRNCRMCRNANLSQ